MKKVLLTGINGFTGKYLEHELLGRGYEVIGVVTSNANTNRRVTCDLTNVEDVKNCLRLVRPDYIVHLAALSFVHHPAPKEFYDVNIFAALNLLIAANDLNLNLSKIIISSSANVYGNPIGIERISETVHPDPVNHYAMSKLAMEQMLKPWFDIYPIVIARPFNYTGPGQAVHFLIPKIVSHFKNRRRDIELGNTNVYRDFSDVRDISKAYVSLLESDVHSEIINLCSGNVYSLSSIISKMEDIAGYKINVKVNPAFVRANEIKVLGGDNSKLVFLTGFKPTITIDQTLLDMYNAN